MPGDDHAPRPEAPYGTYYGTAWCPDITATDCRITVHEFTTRGRSMPLTVTCPVGQATTTLVWDDAEDAQGVLAGTLCPGATLLVSRTPGGIRIDLPAKGGLK